MGNNKEELESARDVSATVLLLKLLEMMETGIKETEKIPDKIQDTVVPLASQIKAIASLSADPISRRRLVESCNNLERHIAKYRKPMPELLKKDVAKIKQAINIATGEHWGLYQLTILAESVEGMKKVNLLPNMTQIPETLTNAVKSLSRNMKDQKEAQ